VTVGVLGTKLVLAGTTDPTAGGGRKAAIGTLYERDNAGAGELWKKLGAGDTAWAMVGGGGVSDWIFWLPTWYTLLAPDALGNGYIEGLYQSSLSGGTLDVNMSVFLQLGTTSAPANYWSFTAPPIVTNPPYTLRHFQRGAASASIGGVVYTGTGRIGNPAFGNPMDPSVDFAPAGIVSGATPGAWGAIDQLHFSVRALYW
jgi:hypothetical protein